MPSMRLLSFVVIWASLGGQACAETVFAVTPEEIIRCSGTGETIGKLSKLKRDGIPEKEILELIRKSGVSNESANAMIRTLYGFDAPDEGTYSKIAGALCILDLLKPRDAK